MTHPEAGKSFQLVTEDGLRIFAAMNLDGSGTLRLADGPAFGPVTSAQVPTAIQALAPFAGHDSELEDTRWYSDEWDDGTLATAVAGWLDMSSGGGATEFMVDDWQWVSDGVGGCSPTDEVNYGLELARLSWDLGPGGGGSPGNNDHGTYLLLKIGTRYTVYHSSGGESTDEGDIEAESDDAAILRFHALYSEPESGDP